MDFNKNSESLKDRTFIYDAMERFDDLVRDDEVDGYIDEIFARIKAAEYVMNGDESTLQERSAYRQELDDQWNYMHKTVTVSGWAYFKKGNITPDIPEYEKFFIENDQEVESTGFTILPMPVVLGDEVMPSYKIGLSFTKKGKDFTMFRNECAIKLPVNPVAMAEKRLLYYHNDEVMNVVGRLNEYDSTHGDTSILALKDYSVEFFMHWQHTEEYKKDLELYLFDVLKFDEKLPYLIGYNAGDQQSDCTFVVADPTYVSLEPHDESDASSPRRHVPYLYASAYSADPRQPNTPLTIPFSALGQFSSIRNLAGQGQ